MQLRKDTMNENTGGTRRSRRVWLLLTCMVGAVLLLTACGSSGGSSSTSATISAQTTTFQKVLAFSECMRSHGVLNFPDPNVNGAITLPTGANKIDLTSAPVKAAIATCRHIFPNDGVLNPEEQEKVLNALLAFSQCMRSHGVTNFPDPALINGKITLSLKGTGITATSPGVVTAGKTCEALVRSIDGTSS
jgi:hypothetical protein